MGWKKNALKIASASVVAMAVAFAGPREGTVYVAAPDPVGVVTVCHGHTRDVKLGDVYTDEQCAAIFNREMTEAVLVVDKYAKVSMPDTRKAALADFVYNVGEPAFARSTLLKKLNAGDTIGACDELPKWVMAKGRKLPGLVKRREAERQLCLKNL